VTRAIVRHFARVTEHMKSVMEHMKSVTEYMKSITEHMKYMKSVTEHIKTRFIIASSSLFEFRLIFLFEELNNFELSKCR
jgi:hypothetical protein